MQELKTIEEAREFVKNHKKIDCYEWEVEEIAQYFLENWECGSDATVYAQFLISINEKPWDAGIVETCSGFEWF